MNRLLLSAILFINFQINEAPLEKQQGVKSREPPSQRIEPPRPIHRSGNLSSNHPRTAELQFSEVTRTVESFVKELVIHLKNRKHVGPIRFCFFSSVWSRCRAQAVALSSTYMYNMSIFDISSNFYVFLQDLMNSHCVTNIISNTKYQLLRMYNRI